MFLFLSHSVFEFLLPFYSGSTTMQHLNSARFKWALKINHDSTKPSFSPKALPPSTSCFPHIVWMQKLTAPKHKDKKKKHFWKNKCRSVFVIHLNNRIQIVARPYRSVCFKRLTFPCWSLFPTICSVSSCFPLTMILACLRLDFKWGEW